MATVANKAEDHKLLVAGERVETDEWSDVESPYDGTPVGRVPKGDAALVDKAAKAARSEKPGEGRTSPVTFYRQVVAELRKVVYPTQEQLVTYFIVVMVFVLVMIAFVSVLDLAFGKAVFAIFGGK